MGVPLHTKKTHYSLHPSGKQGFLGAKELPTQLLLWKKKERKKHPLFFLKRREGGGRDMLTNRGDSKEEEKIRGERHFFWQKKSKQAHVL